MFGFSVLSDAVEAGGWWLVSGRTEHFSCGFLFQVLNIGPVYFGSDVFASIPVFH